MNTSRDPVRARARIGRWALAARTMPEADRRTVFEARLPAGGWPAKMLMVTAVDTRTGEFVVFDSAGEASLVDAVGASCAVPGVWPPVTIGNRRFMDGGVRSVANADLAASYQRVVIVAPVAQGIGPVMPGPGRQAAALAAAGARVALVRPDRAAMRAIGRNVLDVSRRAAAATAGLTQATAEAAAVRAVWQADDGPAASLAVRPGTGSARPQAQGTARAARQHQGHRGALGGRYGTVLRHLVASADYHRACLDGTVTAFLAGFAERGDTDLDSVNARGVAAELAAPPTTSAYPSHPASMGSGQPGGPATPGSCLRKPSPSCGSGMPARVRPSPMGRPPLSSTTTS